MADQNRPGSEFYAPPRKFKDLGDGTFAEVHALEADSIGGGAGGGLTDAQLRASAVPVTVPTPVPVTGPLTDTQLRATPVPVSGTVTASGPLTDTQLRASAVPVSGPLTDAQLRAVPVPVTIPSPTPVTDNAGSLTVDAPVGTPVWVRLSDGSAAFVGQKPMATSLPVVIASDQTTLATNDPGLADTVGQKVMASSAAVVLASDQSVIPVSDNASSLTVDAPVGTPLFSRLSDGAAALIGQKTMASSLPVAIASDQGPVSAGGTNVLKTGTLTTTAVTADQIVLTYTVTAAKTFFLTYIIMYGRLTVLAATATILGAISLETPSGTKVLTLDDVNPTTSELEFNPIILPVPIPVAAGVVVRVVVTPAAATSMLWRANFGGYEK